VHEVFVVRGGILNMKRHVEYEPSSGGTLSIRVGVLIGL
jgi:hypothetical protein